MTKKIVQPLQVRLPDDIYGSLQSVANKSGRTLNAVVIEVLRANLPPNQSNPVFENDESENLPNELFDRTVYYRNRSNEIIIDLSLMINLISKNISMSNHVLLDLFYQKENFKSCGAGYNELIDIAAGMDKYFDKLNELSKRISFEKNYMFCQLGDLSAKLNKFVEINNDSKDI